MKRVHVWFLVFVLATQIPSQAAVTLVSNLSNSESEQVQFWTGSPVYQSFQVGSSNATLTGISLAFGSVVNPTGVQVSLYRDNTSTPGSSLGSFTYFGPPAGIPFNTPSFTGSFNVDANTKYWIGVTTTGGSVGDGNYLSFSGDFSETGLSGWSIGNTFLDTGYGSSPVSNSGSIRMEISGSVPEPSSLSLLALGLVSLALRRRRS